MKIQPSFTYKKLYSKKDYIIYTEANRFYLSHRNRSIYNADNYNDCYRMMIDEIRSEYFTHATDGNY